MAAAKVIVVAAALVATLGRDGKDGEVYLYRGEQFPEGVTSAETHRLIELGLAAEATDEVVAVVVAEPVVAVPAPPAKTSK